MTGLANEVAMRLSYKAYATGAITPGVEPVPATDPGAGTAQQLRRVSSSLNFAKSTFTTNEIRPDRQIFDFRHGGVKVNGSIVGELSPKTYQDFFAAVFRGSWVAGVTKDNTVFTSLAATAASSKFTVAASTWAAQGFNVGDVWRPSNITGPNLGVNFQMVSLNGVDAVVSPTPADMVADTTFTATVPGRKLIPPQSTFVIPKFGIEHFYTDLVLAHLFTECRCTGFKVTMPANGVATVEFTFMGRNLVPFVTGSSPFFTSPTAPTTTTVLATFGGQLVIGGALQGVISAFELTVDLSGSSDNVAFTKVVPEIFTGRLNAKGSITAWYTDDTLLNDFVNETEVEMMLMLTTSAAVGADFISFFLPRVKFGDAKFGDSGEKGVPVTLPFQALEKPVTTGYDNATITMIDSLSA